MEQQFIQCFSAIGANDRAELNQPAGRAEPNDSRHDTRIWPAQDDLC
jgi:hypothetical protein